jgi:hypothetical protein
MPTQSNYRNADFLAIVGTLGVFFLVLVFSDDYDVGLDLAVVVECGVAIPPATLEFDAFVQSELGLSHEKSPRCAIHAIGQLGRFPGMDFRKALTH